MVIKQQNMKIIQIALTKFKFSLLDRTDYYCSLLRNKIKKEKTFPNGKYYETKERIKYFEINFEVAINNR